MQSIVAPQGTFTYAYQGAGTVWTNLALPNTSAVTNGYDTMARLLNTTLKTSGGTVMHFYAGGAVSANVGETLADLISWGIEVSDDVKSCLGSTGDAYDSVDLAWGQRGSELQNAFDVSECKCRKLARKFQNSTFTPSNWQGWYGKPGSVLY